MQGKLSEDLGRMLKEEGACLYGFADLAEVTAGKWPAGVSIALSIPREIVLSIGGGPNGEYFKTYYELNEKLDRLARLCRDFLQDRGYQALAQTTDAVEEFGNYRTWLPHKTVATCAGLGWIGKSALLVTEEYGSAVRLTSVLTNAPLVTGNTVSESRCGKCMVCAGSCPAGAVSGKLWNNTIDRDEFVDIEACRKKW